MTPTDIALLKAGMDRLAEKIDESAAARESEALRTHQQLADVKQQVTLTNGRVTTLEKAWERGKGFAQAMTLVAGFLGFAVGAGLGILGIWH